MLSQKVGELCELGVPSEEQVVGQSEAPEEGSGRSQKEARGGARARMQKLFMS